MQRAFARPTEVAQRVEVGEERTVDPAIREDRVEGHAIALDRPVEGKPGGRSDRATDNVIRLKARKSVEGTAQAIVFRDVLIDPREIQVADIGSIDGNVQQRKSAVGRDRFGLRLTLVVDEEMRFSLEHRAAHSAAVLLVLIRLHLVRKEVRGVQRIVAKVQEPAPVHDVGARLGHRVDHRRARVSELGIEPVRQNFELIDDLLGHLDVDFSAGRAILNRRAVQKHLTQVRVADPG